MTFLFHPEANIELSEAVDYYEECEAGLGYDFAAEVFAAIQNIVRYPSAWPLIEADSRRRIVNRFPYGVIYSVEQNEIFILAIAHLRKPPRYWQNRH